VHPGVELQDGQQDGEDDEGHRAAHADDHHGLEQRGQRGDAHLDLRLVGGGDVDQHLLELSAFLADGDHVVDERRELAAALERGGDGLALADGVARLLDDVGEHGVVHDVLDDVHRREQRDAALEQRGEVREKREMAIIRTSPPKTGALSTSRSHLALPLGVFFHARKP